MSRIARKTFDCRDLAAVRLHGEHEARAHGASVAEHGACAAYAMLAAGMRPCQQQALAQTVEQAHARLDVERV